jgi:hypothetical protein
MDSRPSSPAFSSQPSSAPEPAAAAVAITAGRAMPIPPLSVLCYVSLLTGMSNGILKLPRQSKRAQQQESNNNSSSSNNNALLDAESLLHQASKMRLLNPAFLLNLANLSSVQQPMISAPNSLTLRRRDVGMPPVSSVPIHEARGSSNEEGGSLDGNDNDSTYYSGGGGALHSTTTSSLEMLPPALLHTLTSFSLIGSPSPMQACDADALLRSLSKHAPLLSSLSISTSTPVDIAPSSLKAIAKSMKNSLQSLSLANLSTPGTFLENFANPSIPLYGYSDSHGGEGGQEKAELKSLSITDCSNVSVSTILCCAAYNICCLFDISISFAYSDRH